MNRVDEAKNLANLLGKVGKGSYVSVLSESEISKNDYFLQTPFYDLNRILSGSLYKGIAIRRFLTFVGPEATFKSSTMALCAAQSQKDGFLPIIFDTEGAWDHDFCDRWGLKKDEAIVIIESMVEPIIEKIAALKDSEDYKKVCVIIDSIGNLEIKKLVEDSKKGDYKDDQGTLQKRIKRLVKLLNGFVKTRSSITMVSGHLYGNTSGYGAPEQMGGGKHLRMISDYILSLKKEILYENPTAKSKEAKGKETGTQIKVSTLKNRLYPKGQEATLKIDYTKGIDKMSGLTDIAIDLGMIEVSGSWYTLPNGNKVQGMEKLQDYVSKNPKPFLEHIENHLKNTGYSTFREEIEDLLEPENEQTDEEKPKKRTYKKKEK